MGLVTSLQPQAPSLLGARIYSELRGMGYKGSLSSVYRYLRGIREEEERKEKVTTRVETGDVIRAIEEGVYYFGGVTQEVVMDN